MGGYTIVNSREVEDQVPKLGYSPELEARFARVSLEPRTGIAAISGSLWVSASLSGI